MALSPRSGAPRDLIRAPAIRARIRFAAALERSLSSLSLSGAAKTHGFAVGRPESAVSFHCH